MTFGRIYVYIFICQAVGGGHLNMIHISGFSLNHVCPVRYDDMYPSYVFLMHHWLVVSNIFYFHLYIGKDKKK